MTQKNPTPHGRETVIKERAYHLWVRAGQPHGHDQAHWFQAEHEIHKELQMTASPAIKPKKKAGTQAKTSGAKKKPAVKAKTKTAAKTKTTAKAKVPKPSKPKRSTTKRKARAG